MNELKKKNNGKHSTETSKNKKRNENIANSEPDNKLDIASGEKANKKTKSHNKTAKIVVIAVVVVLILAILAIILFNIFSKKVKDHVQLELGTQEIKIQDFLTDEKYAENAEFVTDISQIDLSKVATYEITIKLNDKEYTSTLDIKDTTAPQVKFQDVDGYTDYQINPEDFIAEKTDASNM